MPLLSPFRDSVKKFTKRFKDLVASKLKPSALPFTLTMPSRYEAYYRSIPSLGGDPDRADPGETVTPVRTRCSTPHPVMRRPSVLEAQHPDIVQAITLLWGYPEMNAYFERLWLDDGSSRPLAPEAMSELMLLAGVHQWLTPQRPARTMASIYDASARSGADVWDVWDEVPRRR
jgi:hypothetical protein